MDEDIAIINSNNRTEKIKNFLIKNKKGIIISVLIFVLSIITFFLFDDIKKKKKIKLSEKYSLATMNFVSGEEENSKNLLFQIINENDITYSPLALYFLIDNNIVTNKEEINELFDKIIYKTKLESEILNLLIYKKAIFNANFNDENLLIEILNPLVNSNSIWQSHALFLLGEFFYHDNQKEKAKEFFNKIISLENSNQNIKIEAQKRINRDFSD
tara:strand:+ start:561 stop:1205 length:645 start_codon:yes stop_codon:yes gene_type:complete